MIRGVEALCKHLDSSILYILLDSFNLHQFKKLVPWANMFVRYSVHVYVCWSQLLVTTKMFHLLKIGLTIESDMDVAQGYSNFQKLLCITVLHKFAYPCATRYRMQISSDSISENFQCLILNLGGCTIVIHTVFQKFAYPRETRLPGSMGDPIIKLKVVE